MDTEHAGQGEWGDCIRELCQPGSIPSHTIDLADEAVRLWLDERTEWERGEANEAGREESDLPPSIRRYVSIKHDSVHVQFLEASLMHRYKALTDSGEGFEGWIKRNKGFAKRG